MFIVFYCISSKVCLGLIWWFLDVYRVQDQTKEEFVTNVVQVEMQCYHFYTARHVAKATNATAAYRTKHRIVETNMS
jgi:hypothetical protein